MKVLYVDDDADDGEIFQEAIRTIDASINCVIVSTGMEAIQRIAEECPDYIFLDYHMPLMNGVEVLKEIQLHSCSKETRIIMYSTTMNDLTMKECKELGVYDCLEKSTEFLLLCAVLKKALGLG
ncbi:MAG: response regulator [Chryseosolibacter sp.]